MNTTVLIIWSWAFLAVVVIAYVVYRLVTDRRSDLKRHGLYPFVSNPTDGMFPEKNDYLGRVGYILIFVGFAGFLVVFWRQVMEHVITPYLVNGAGAMLLVGIAIVFGSRVMRKEHK